MKKEIVKERWDKDLERWKILWEKVEKYNKGLKKNYIIVERKEVEMFRKLER